MGSADVARLRFILSADSSGLKAGTKEASGSLKDMSSNVRGEFGRMDSSAMDWKGLKRSARSLRFVGREMGGIMKGGIGDAIGIATAGVGLGPLGAGLAIGAAGYSLYQSHQEQLEKDRQKAVADYRGARAHGIDAGMYANLSSIAGDDTKFLDEMASSMKDLAEAGPNASGALKSIGKDIENLSSLLGLSGKDNKEFTREQTARRAEATLSGLGKDYKLTGAQDIDLMEKYFTDKYKKQGMDQETAAKKAAEKMDQFSQYNFWGKRVHSGWYNAGSEEAWKDASNEFQGQIDQGKNRIADRTSLRDDPGLQTNREQLTHKLQHLRDQQKDINADADLSDADKKEFSERIGRGTWQAIDEYRKSQGGPPGMAGAATAGSEEAYSIVAKAQMGAAGAGNDVATTNDILAKQFPELIGAVKGLNPNWRRADSAT